MLKHHKLLLLTTLVVFLLFSYAVAAANSHSNNNNNNNNNQHNKHDRDDIEDFDDDLYDQDDDEPDAANFEVGPHDDDHDGINMYDADEFDGINVEHHDQQHSTASSSSSSPSSSSPASSSSSSSSNKPKDNVVASPDDNLPFTQKYWAEVCALVFVVVYILNFFIGRTQNDKIARSWAECYNNLFQQQFYMIGAFEGDVGTTILKDSQSCYKYYVSGRRNCSGLLATLELRKRHDLFSILLATFDLAPSRDIITLEVAMNNDKMDPFVFAIVPSKQEKRFRKTEKDIEVFAATSPTQKSNSFVILTDCADLVDDFVDDTVVRLLEKNIPYLSSIHFTDKSHHNNGLSKKLLRFTFYLPPANEMVKLEKLMELALQYIDVVASTSLSQVDLARAKKKREQYELKTKLANQEQAKEEIMRRKEEMKKKQESNLSEAQLRKKEEKEAKKALKKKQPRVKVLR